MTSILAKLAPIPAEKKEIKSVCVFCGSSTGANPKYEEEAKAVGKVLGQNKLRLVYGGGSVGLMGAVAQETINNGGEGLAVVPEPLFKHGSKQICEYTIVPDMHTRKKRMADESDAFVVLPGGYGTMEEMLEMITWSQLNIHAKPIILLNTNGYFNLFVEWIKLSVQEQFVSPKNFGIFVLCDSAEDIIDALKSYNAPDSRYGLDWTQKERQSLV